VAFPTETVYGLGADATNEIAISRIYTVKGRPVGHPLIVHISSINQLDVWATDIPEYAIKLAREFWPGPMTLILPRKEIAKDFITGGQNNVGLRVPAQPIALALLKKFEDFGGQGVAAPSANRFGAVSPTTAEAVSEELGNYLSLDDLVIDGGKCLVGIESTIIDCTQNNPQILRPGWLTNTQIEKISSTRLFPSLNKNIVRTSGKLDFHYRPKTKVYLNSDPKIGEGLLALKTYKTPEGVIRLGDPSNLVEFSQQLYAIFRKADKLQLSSLHVILNENSALAEAILDRVKKASEH
jgi:L-threonylcarbamoyladenylate synthase